MGRPAAVPAAPAELLTLTAVLVRGLQGSGKSTLCRALAHLTQGEWINQDEVAAGPRVLLGRFFFLLLIKVAGRGKVQKISYSFMHAHIFA